MKYLIEYDYQQLAEVEIDEEKAEKPIKQMVEFWSNWERPLEENEGDYTKTWLKSLALFILERGRIPSGDGWNIDEGWCKLDGTFGIKVLYWSRFDFDEEQIDIIAKS